MLAQRCDARASAAGGNPARAAAPRTSRQLRSVISSVWACVFFRFFLGCCAAEVSESPSPLWTALSLPLPLMLENSSDDSDPDLARPEIDGAITNRRILLL